MDGEIKNMNTAGIEVAFVIVAKVCGCKEGGEEDWLLASILLTGESLSVVITNC
jgi:hypothetical protein